MREGSLPDVPAGRYLDAYIEAAGIEDDKGAPLWQSMTKEKPRNKDRARRERRLNGKRMTRFDVFRMIKRRVRDAELGDAANCHTFRATGITAYTERRDDRRRAGDRGA